MSRTWRPLLTTGHPDTDALIPAALRLVGAVRDGDPEAMADAETAAREASGRDDWQHLLVLTLAAMVPDGAPASKLLAWCQRDRSGDFRYRPYHVSGEEHPHAKLSDADVAAIRAAYDPRDRRCVRRLAEKYGVTRQNIYKILRYETRKAG